MNSKVANGRSEVSEARARGTFLLFLGLCLIGALFSFLTVEHHARALIGLNTASAACNINQTLNCDAVLASKFSTLFGIPLGSYGIGFYLVLLLISYAARRNQEIVLLSSLRALLIILGAVTSAVLLVITELYVGSMCPYCAVTYLVNFILLCMLCCGKPSPRSWRQELAGLIRVSTWGQGLSQSRGLLSLVLAAALFGAALFASLPWAQVYVLWRSGDGSPQSGNSQSGISQPRNLDPDAELQSALAAWASGPQEELQLSAASGILQEYRKGPVSAAIEIVEYSDFQCPACRNFYPVLEELMAEYPGKVALVFRNFPLDKACNPLLLQPGHLFACQAAEAARCAGEQGQYWQMVEYIFSEPAFEAEGLDATGFLSTLRAEIEKRSLDLQAFDECMLSGRQRERIQQDIQSGIALKLKGTPTLFVNGRRVQTLRPALIRAIFERELR
jgi:protein-disulfide isomerase/uncharacterized membrane protein